MRAKRLGRGLGGLLGRAEEGSPGAGPRVGNGETPPGTATLSAGGRLGGTDGARTLPLDAVRPNPWQPRRVFEPAALEELEASIRQHGVLQPIVVRPADAGFELVAGERRLRAARSAGLASIPAVVRPTTDEEMQTLALVENLQREDLGAMEKARALAAMLSAFGLTQEEVAQRVGKARATIANLVRLLDLPPEVQRMVEEGRLSGAHARAVLQAEGTARRVALARRAVEHGWSVREVERQARAGPTHGKKRTPPPEDPYLRDLSARLERRLSAPVRVERVGRAGGGRILVRYHDPDDLDRLLEMLEA